MITFNELGLNSSLISALDEKGFETPTPIQIEMIPYLLENSGDVVGLAQTGTGKTAAFGLPVLQKTDCSVNKTQVLVLAPTRELCTQVAREITEYGKNLKKLTTAAVYGGAPFGPQIRSLRMGSHIVVATPGRLRDLLEKGVADFSSVRFLILDEADQMLDMGFKEDLDLILDSASDDRQTLLFSATMPPDVARIASKYMTNPHEIVAGERNKGTSTVEHLFYRVHAGDKYAALRRLIDFEPDMYGLIFCRTRDSVRSISTRLGKAGYSADSLHGDLSQNQREEVLNRFRHGSLKLLVATDVAARGLDVENLTHVIHFDLPDEAAVYNHRSGRTGRAGKRGKSLALVHLKEGYRIQRIEKVLGRKINPGRIPGGTEICEKQLENLALKAAKINNNEDSELPDIWIEIFQKHLGSITANQLIEKLVALELGPLLKEYANAEDINPPPPPRRSRRDAEKIAGSRSPSGDMKCLRINLGRRHSVLPPQVIGLVNQVSHSRNIQLGRIDIHPDWSEFQIEAESAGKVEKALRGFNYRGVKIRVDRVDRLEKSRNSGHYSRKKYSGSSQGKKYRYQGGHSGTKGKKSKKKY